MEDTNINHLKVTVPESGAGIRIRRWLLTHYRSIAKSQKNLHRAFNRQEITINGRPAEESRILSKDDIVEVKYNKSIEEATKLKAVPIRICYEDDYLAVVWKPSGQNFVLFEKAIHFNTALKDVEGNRQKVWCINNIQKAASGLIIVAKTEEIKDQLTEEYNNDKINITMRLMVHGFVPTNDMSVLFDMSRKLTDQEYEPVIPDQVAKSIHIISQTRSNNSLYISRLDLDLHTPLSSTNLRRLFYFYSDHQIIGNSKFTRPLKVNSDKGLCIALLALSFIHPVTKACISIKEEEPAKFGVMCDREARFYQLRVDKEAEEIKRSGVLPIDLEERKEGQLLPYLLGQKEFCNLVFKVTKDCLIPRTSSETLVQAAVTFLKDKEHARVIDIGTGCGNLLVSILKNIPTATGIGIDISEGALSVAKENADQLLKDQRAEWRLQDMSDISEQEKFDVLVCNPPYLDYEKASKHKEKILALNQEPAEALFAKENGYEWYIVLHRMAPHLVKEDGRVILECGKNMMDKVLEIWSDWKQDSVHKDVQGWDRCLVLTKK